MMKHLLGLELIFHYNFILIYILILKLNFHNSYEFDSGTSLKYYFDSKGIEFRQSMSGSKILFFYSNDCQINLEAIDSSGHSELVCKISNYYYDAFYIKVYTSLKIKVNPLILSQKEINKNRTYSLLKIANPNKKPEIPIHENEPLFIYFNQNTLLKTQLAYMSQKDPIKKPILISFFIKEKQYFNIDIYNYGNTQINRSINYKENILIEPESESIYFFIITPNENMINSTMIATIIQNYSSPINLQKNQLNLGFIPKNVENYYYYMEVFKGEEGEIMLFNKRQNGILISKIIEKNSDVPKMDKFPKYNIDDEISKDYLDFNIYNQRLSFNSSYTEKCEKGCYLLITYYSNISNSLELDGTEFSLLCRIWDEEELISQIINIPLNEYIFGFFDKTTINIHYYTIFIPYDADNVYIELHGNNINAFFKEGIDKIDTTNISNNTKKLFYKCQNKMIIKLNPEDIGLDSFKGLYISFAFEKDSININSYYYFRILQQNSENNYMLYPLDTNKENYCKTNNSICYFLLKNEYNELSNKFVIYGLGKNDASYKLFYMNDKEYYSKNLNLDQLKEIKNIQSFNNFIILDLKMKEHFILIEVKPNEEENFTFISNFYNPSNSSSIDIYSYQLYHLSEKQYQQFTLKENPYIKYRVLINNTKGEGYIYFNQTCDSINNNIHITEQKIYSFSFSNKTSFSIYAENNLTYNIKIIHEISNEVIKELNYQYNFEKIDLNKDIFPLIYFIKDVKYNGISINFFFKFKDSNKAYNNLIIKGIELDYSEISLIKEKKDIEQIDFTNGIKGKYDNITNNGRIDLSNELIHKEEYKYTEDKYFVIIIENISSFEFEHSKIDIYVFSKDENYILLPINKYIRNSFNLIEGKNITQKYFFDKENITNKEFILEFSSNYKNIELTFNNLTTNSPPKMIGGFNKYVLTINSNDSSDYYFNIVIKPTHKLNEEKDLKEVNIIIKYYKEEEKIDIDYICNKTFKLNIINNTEEYSNYSLIINNLYEINKSSNDLNYIYYLSLIQKSKILLNEELNTIAPISSNLSYINKYNSSETKIYLNNLFF